MLIVARIDKILQYATTWTPYCSETLGISSFYPSRKTKKTEENQLMIKHNPKLLRDRDREIEREREREEGGKREKNIVTKREKQIFGHLKEVSLIIGLRCFTIKCYHPIKREREKQDELTFETIKTQVHFSFPIVL